MIAALDVHYSDSTATAAAVWFGCWEAPRPVGEHAVTLPSVAPYEPGAFYRRELPCLLAVLGRVPAEISTVIVDGYAWLEGESKPGLGAHLFRALGGRLPVVGVDRLARR